MIQVASTTISRNQMRRSILAPDLAFIIHGRQSANYSASASYLYSPNDGARTGEMWQFNVPKHGRMIGRRFCVIYHGKRGNQIHRLPPTTRGGIPSMIDRPITCAGRRHGHLYQVAAQSMTLATTVMTRLKVPVMGLRVSVHQARDGP